MKNFNAFFTIVIACLALTSCSKDDEPVAPLPDPVAEFSFETATDNPQLVSFVNSSENAEEFIWDFGDGSEVSTQKHPTHKFETAGDYTVVLTAFRGENKDVFTQDVIVQGIPTANFSYEADQDDSYTMHFTNLSENTNAYTWDFGDGTGTSSEENPVYTYSEAGTYTVTLTATGDAGTDEISMEVEVSDAQPTFNEIYIVGDASESGWNIASPEAFVQSETNPFIFNYEGVLSPGKLKFSTFTGDWCDGEWINAPEADAPATGTTDFIVTQGCDGPDNQWVVTKDTQGYYNVQIDLAAETVTFQKQTPPYSELYAIGDASPNGWVPQTPEEGFIQDPADPFIFTYEAYLSPRELKISTFKGEWCDGDWLNAAEADQPITEAEFIMTTGCEGPDNKWRITEETEGDYIVKVNFHTNDITFEKQ